VRGQKMLALSMLVDATIEEKSRPKGNFPLTDIGV
jgi:hypothetical protein